MLMPALKKYGHFSVNDSGVPHELRDYTTLIIFHGVAFHSAIFGKLFPFLGGLKTRLVTVNRPDYPGATPLTDKERMQLNNVATMANQNPELATRALLDYVTGEARKTHDFLAEFITRESIPVHGGIVLAGWSFGTTTILGLLANVNAVSSKEPDLSSYIKHVVFYDPPSCLLGYAPPPNKISPLFDPSLTSGEALKIFPQWVSSYYALNDDPAKLGFDALDHPRPTILSMDPADVQQCMEVGPALPGGSDQQFMQLGIHLGVFAKLREAVICLDKRQEGDPGVVNAWDDIEIKHVWCDQSVWDMPWAAVCLQADLDSDKKAGRLTRKVEMVRLRGGNHFCHWDQPEVAFRALLSGLNL